MKSLLTGIFFFIIPLLAIGQQPDPDKILKEAQVLAASFKYNQAIELCKRNIEKNPRHWDSWILLGRIYFWKGNADSSKIILRALLNQAKIEEAYYALSDVMINTKDLPIANETVNEGLIRFPGSVQLKKNKIRLLFEEKQFSKALSLSDSLFKSTTNAEFKTLSNMIRPYLFANAIGLNYDLDHFTKRYENNWHLRSLFYSHTFSTGPLIVRLNNAERFALQGNQLELDYYPNPWKKTSFYLNAGVGSQNVFPAYRMGISVYQGLKSGFEAEAGLRLLKFSESTIIYIAGIGKYAGNFWFCFRPSFVKCDSGNCYKSTYSFLTRYYFGTVKDFVTLSVAYGSTPDERTGEFLINRSETKEMSARLSFQKVFAYKFIGLWSIGLTKEEYLRGQVESDLRYSFGLGIQILF